MSSKMGFLVCSIILLLSVTPAAELHRISGNEGSATASPVPVHSGAKLGEGQLVKVNLGDNNDQASIRNRELVTRWSNLYTLSAWIYAVRQTSDGGYVLAGSSSIANVGSRAAFLMRIDSHGGIVWQKTYSTTDEYESSLTSVWETSDGGIIAAGRFTTIVRTPNSVGLGPVELWIFKTDSRGVLIWQKAYGETFFDDYPSIQQTSDGGYVVASSSPSPSAKYSSGAIYGTVMRLDAAGNMTWKDNFGTTIDGVSVSARSVQQTIDGGFIVGGYIQSRETSDRTTRAWLLKLTGNGIVTWQREYTPTLQYDLASAIIYSVKQTSDGGYIAGGALGFYHSGLWVLRTDPDGAILWQERIDSNYSSPILTASIDTIQEGGFILAGNIAFGQGGIIKLGPAGSIIWARATSGTVEQVSSIQHTSDGGFIATGTASLNYVRVPWTLKLDTNGLCCTQAFSNVTLRVSKTSATGAAASMKPIEFQNTITTPETLIVNQLGRVFSQCLTSQDHDDGREGGSSGESSTVESTWVKSYNSTINGSSVSSIKQTPDGGYIGSGVTVGVNGTSSLWVFRLDTHGNITWESIYQGSGNIWQTREGGHIVVGSTIVGGVQKALFLKLDGYGKVQWAETYGVENARDMARSFVENPDGSYTVIGTRTTSPVQTWPQVMHSWIVKLDNEGGMIWQKLYATTGNTDVFSSIETTSNHGYIVSGLTTLADNQTTLPWIIALDISGKISWQHTYSFTYNNEFSARASDAHETRDGGYIVLGANLMKLDHNGNVVWNTLGVDGFSVDETRDGGYIVSGGKSYDRGGDYATLTKTDSMGNIEWKRILSMGAGAVAISTSNGGYLIAGGQVGCAWMCGDSPSIGPALILKLDSHGNCCNNPARFISDFGYVFSPALRTMIKVDQTNAWASKADGLLNGVSAQAQTVNTEIQILCESLVMASNKDPN